MTRAELSTTLRSPSWAHAEFGCGPRLSGSIRLRNCFGAVPRLAWRRLAARSFRLRSPLGQPEP